MGIIQDLGYGSAGAWRNYNTSGVPSSGAHEPTKAEIKSFIDAVASSVNADSILNYGGVPDGSTDNKAALDAAVAACVANGCHFLRLPATADGSIYNFTSEPAKINAPLVILGDGIERTTINKAYTSSASTRGLFHWETGSFTLSGMSILAKHGVTKGAAVSMIATGPGVEPGWSNLEEIRISSDPVDGWDYGIYFDGHLNNGGAQGIRDIGFKRVYCFGADIRSVFLKSTFIFRWDGGGVFQETGDGNGDGTLEIGGSSDVSAFHFNIDIETVSKLKFSPYVQNGIVKFASCDSIENDTENYGLLTMGRVSSGVQTNWKTSGSCRHIDPNYNNNGNNGTGTWYEVGSGSNIFVQKFSTTLTGSYVTKSFPKTFGGGVISISATMNGSAVAGVNATNVGSSSADLATESAATGQACTVTVLGVGPLT